MSNEIESKSVMSMPGLDLGVKPGTLLLPGDSIATLVDTKDDDNNNNIMNKTKKNPHGMISKSESIDDRVPKKRPVVRLGSGTTQRERQVLASKSGELRYEMKRNKVWLYGNQRRYVPVIDDMVIGIIQEKHSEEYRLDINGTDTATLSSLSFEGASKKNKPNLQVGNAVFSRIINASKNTEAELSCIEPGSARSWTSGETMYGELRAGFICKVSLALSRQLVRKGDLILNTLGQYVAFQSAVGVNGRVWIQASDVKQTVALVEAVKQADILEVEEWKSFVQKLFTKT